MSKRSDVIAKAIFDWLDNDNGPYTYNTVGPLIIGVDGDLDCGKLAAAIDAVLPKDSQS